MLVVGMIRPPLGFKLQLRQIAQRRVNTFGLVHIADEMPNVGPSISEIPVLIEVDFFFLAGTDDPLGIAILCRFANLTHTDLHVASLPAILLHDSFHSPWLTV